MSLMNILESNSLEMNLCGIPGIRYRKNVKRSRNTKEKLQIIK
jgi:hypothetical protein